jgi:hypothetical protein
MKPYEGFTEADFAIIKFAIHKLDIKGVEAVTIATLLNKIEKEIALLQVKHDSKENPPS